MSDVLWPHHPVPARAAPCLPHLQQVRVYMVAVAELFQQHWVTRVEQDARLQQTEVQQPCHSCPSDTVEAS